MDESEFNTYISNITFFKGEMNDLANSIEIVLDLIFEKNKCKNFKKLRNDPEMLGAKIAKFEYCKSTISIKYSGDFDELVDKLRKFNNNWKITKHGITVGGLKEPTIYKDGNFYVFDEKKRLEVSLNFSQIMKDLIEISK